MADVLAPEGYAETARMEEADLIVLNTCHIREKAADKVFSELGKVRVLKEARAAAGRNDQNRRRGLRRAGRRRGNSAQAARRRSRRRSAELSSPAGIVAPVGAEAGHRHGFSGRRQIRSPGPAVGRQDPPARRQRLFDGPGRLRQVLRLLRRALYARRGSFAAAPQKSSPRPRRLARAGRARNHSARPERQCLSWAKATRRRDWSLAELLYRSPKSRASPACAT